MLNNATWKTCKLVSSSTFRVDDVDIASTACCIGEVGILATVSRLLRHDKSQCSLVRLLRVEAAIPVVTRLPTVVADGRATLLLRLLPWLLPLLLRWLRVLLINVGNPLPDFASTLYLCLSMKAWRLAGVTTEHCSAKWP